MTTHLPPDSVTKSLPIDLVTLSLVSATYGLIGVVLFGLKGDAVGVSIGLLALLLTLHSSLSHEAIHGHPFRNDRLNCWLMGWPVGVFVPYLRFREQHLAHHKDARLTDPYDDPESNYLDPDVWRDLPQIAQVILRVNNTLAGRIIIGPALGTACFAYHDARDIWAETGEDRRILVAWLWHFTGLFVVGAVVFASGLPIWAYLTASYCALGILRIRTFLEHRAHVTSRARTVIIEDNGPLAFLFLNNNLHGVHHAHPSVAWHQLPAVYQRGKDRFLRMNDSYVYRSYGQVFRQYFWRAKDPVAHPLWSRDE
jgi:fatty acid desaturase